MSIRTGIMNTNSASKLSQRFPPAIIGVVMVAGRPVAEYAPDKPASEAIKVMWERLTSILG